MTYFPIVFKINHLRIPILGNTLMFSGVMGYGKCIFLSMTTKHCKWLKCMCGEKEGENKWQASRLKCYY